MDDLVMYSIGHSDHSIERFTDLLVKYQINCVIDVRSSPYSKRIPQFNKELLNLDLHEKSIDYIYLGNKLGGRYSDQRLLFEDKKVNFEKVRETVLFKEGIDEMVNFAKQGKNVAFMCAEKDPFDCHRFVLISRALSLKGITVKHILEDGSYVSNDELDEKLLRKYKHDYMQMNLFRENQTREDALAEAYRLRNLDIAFVSEENGGQK